MGDKNKQRRFIDEVYRLLEAGEVGNFDLMLNEEGLSDEDKELVSIANKLIVNYKAAMEYNLMKYRLTSDALGIALWDMDIVPDDPANPDSRLIWSEEARKMLGFTDENDFPNKLSSLTDRIHPEDRDRAVGAFAAHIMDKTGKSLFDVEYRLKTKSGEYRHFHAFGTTLRDKDGMPLRVAGAIDDIEDRVRTRESLKKAEEERIALANLVNILNGLSAMICVTDPETDELLFINNSMRKAFEIDYDCTGQKCYKVLRGYDERCDFCPCNKLLPESVNTNAVYAWEHCGKNPGETFHHISRYIKWPGGRIAHIQNSVDITDIKQAQAELESQNLRLNLLLGGLKIGFWDRYVDTTIAYDDDKAQIWWSDEFRKLLGYTDENDFPNEVGAWLGSVHPDDLPMTIDAMTRFLDDRTGKTKYDVENRMRLKTGEYRWFRSFGSAIRDADGNPVRTAGATEDITERKKSEQELAERGEFIQTLFDNAPVGVTLFDENYKYIDCNEQILKMFGGITRHFYSEYFGSPAHSPEYQPDGSKSYDKALEVIRQAVIEGQNIKFEWVHQMPDGQPFPVEITMTRIKQDDKYVGLAYVYDMREQNRLKEQLQAALRNAEDANKAKSDFLARMSHEIRTPMNAILGITEIQIRSGRLSEETDEALGKIYESGNMLMGIINDILDLSKIEADKLELIPVSYDIMSMVNDTAQLNRMRSNSELIGFDIKLDENTPQYLIGDELRIKQILNNLLSNAFKYTEKGNVEFSITSEPLDTSKPPKNSNMPKDADVMLIFRVSDTGQGMSKEQLDILFTDYTRFNLETNRTTTGTGLGLSITKQLTDLMGGEVIVDSELGEGSVFTVKIPQIRDGDQICGAELAERLRNVRFHSASLAKKSQFVREYMPYGSVLIVDDVESNIYVGKGMLLPYGLEIDEAYSGFEVIEKVKNGNTYDIIFMDHMMPKMDGVEATRILREMGYTAPIVALTANAVIGQSEMLLNSGFDGFVSKPIDSRELNQVLNELIRNKKPAEVVKAARHEQEMRRKKTQLYKQMGAEDALGSVDKSNMSDDMKKFIIRDASKAVDVLKKLYPKITAVTTPEGAIDDATIDEYIVTVHGMKSALANIGQADMSAVSQRLELAGKDYNFSVMIDETPDFVTSLQALIDEISPTEEAAEVAASEGKDIDADLKTLKEKLLEIKEACESYNVSDARNILAEQLKKTWPKDIGDALDEINLHLLHSAFEEAAEAAEKLAK